MNFEITEEQLEKLRPWLEEQDELCKHQTHGAVGGGTTFEFTPTSLGVIVKVFSGCSGNVLDITDYENW
jgi:hypothetical protein